MGYVNKDFFVTRDAIQQWFSLVTLSLMKILAEWPHLWHKIIIYVNPYIILYILDCVIVAPDCNSTTIGVK